MGGEAVTWVASAEVASGGRRRLLCSGGAIDDAVERWPANMHPERPRSQNWVVAMPAVAHHAGPMQGVGQRGPSGSLLRTVPNCAQHTVVSFARSLHAEPTGKLRSNAGRVPRYLPR